MTLTITCPLNGNTTITTDISAISLGWTKDYAKLQKIVARVRPIPQAFVVWHGADEYASAGEWTNDTVLARATELLTLSANSIQWIV
jgi:hypothetical protein